MSADAQKLELITWITGLTDKKVLDQLYIQVKKTLESQETDTPDGDSTLPGSGAGVYPLQALEQIVGAYVALDEPDLNLTQIYKDRMKANERKIDFN